MNKRENKGMQIFGVILITSACYQCVASTTHAEEETLQQKFGPVIFANLVYRHGERTILCTFPTDPHKNSSLWKPGFGELRMEGEERQYRLGCWIRHRYPELVGERYSSDALYVRSSDVDRCLMSAYANLAGMYPKGGVGGGLAFHPVPVHSRPKEIDNMILTEAPCPKYDQETEALKGSDYMRDIDRRLAPLYTNLSRLTGRVVNDIHAVSQIYDTLKIEGEDMNLSLPLWADGMFPEPLRQISLESFLARTHTDEMKRLKGGPLLTEIREHLSQKAAGRLEPDRKLWVYSGHDETIIALLRTLRLRDFNICLPSYATLLSVELRRKEDRHFVTIIYKDGMSDTATELHMDGCGDEACTLDEFLSLTQGMVVDNWTQECRLSEESSSKIRVSDDIKLGAIDVAALGLLVLCPALIVALCCRPRAVARYRRLRNQND